MANTNSASKAKTAESFKEVFTPAQAQGIEARVSEMHSRRDSGSAMGKWMQEFTRLSAERMDFIDQYGVRKGILSKDIKRYSNKGGVWKFLAEHTSPDSKLHQRYMEKYLQKAKYSTDAIEAEYNDALQILTANCKAGEGIITLLYGVKDECMGNQAFYTTEDKRLSQDLMDNLTNQKTLEDTIKATKNELSEARNVCENLGMVFDDATGELKTSSTDDASISDITKQQQRLEARNAYNEVYTKLTTANNEMEDLKNDELTKYRIMIDRIADEKEFNARILMKTIPDLIREQKIIQAEYEAEIAYGTANTKALAKVTTAQAVSADLLSALEEWRDLNTDIAKHMVEGVGLAMDKISEFVLQDRWDKDMLADLEVKLDDTYQRLEDLRAQKAEKMNIIRSYTSGEAPSVSGQ